MSGGDNLLDFEIRPNPAPVADAERAALLADPGFGRIFTDHMVTVRYAEGKGWYEPRVEARAPIPMDPATAVLHYAQEIFEGLKAYQTPDGGVAMFRPDANAARFAQSAQRMAMPVLPPATFLESLRQIITIDRSWIPDTDEGSLYLRPFAYASEVFLGVRPAMEYLYLVIASPVGPYFARGVKPVNVWITPDYTRAAPGVTRDSVLKLAQRAGRRVEERPVSFDEWRDGATSGRIREAFACGTAAVITPIGTVRHPDGEFTVADGGSGEVTMALRQELVNIQRGRAEDPFGWVHRVL
jgi:branched-subunit amino acid aminotransferase/4-amino-4-deoxychorismate lyase